MSKRSVVIVDDDPKMRTLIRRCLEPEGFAVEEAASSGQLMALLSARTFSLITLDISLPDGDGFEVAKAIRQHTSTPIVMITGKGDVFDRVVGLEVGADDYLAKPFHVRELLARVKAVLRRSGVSPAAEGEDAYVVDSLRIFPARRAVLDASNEAIPLTSGEYDLLLALVMANGRPLTRDALMDAVHGREAAAFDRSIDNLVARIRKRLPNGMIKTVRTVGYQLGAPAIAQKLRWPTVTDRIPAS